MSAPNTPNFGQQVTGTEDAGAFEQFVQGEIQKQWKKFTAEQQMQTGGGQAPPAPPIKVKLPDGTEHVFQTPEELNASLANLYTQVQQVVATNQQLQEKVSKTPIETKPNEPAKFDKEVYVKLLSEDPIKAQSYILDFSPEVQGLKKELEYHRGNSRAIVSNQFQDMFPRFPASPQTAQIMEAYRVKFNENFDVDGLKKTYLLAMADGALPFDPEAFVTLKQQQQQPQNQGQQPQFQQQQQYAPPINQYNQQGPLAPPSVGRGSGDLSPNVLDMAENLPLDQLEKILTSGGTYPGFTGRR
jgi:hypothetical protein